MDKWTCVVLLVACSQSANGTSNQCALQGQFHGSADLTLTPSDSTCWTPGMDAYSSSYDVTISGTDITIKDSAQDFVSTGTIDAQCRASATYLLFTAFDVVFDSAAMTMSGTLTRERSDGCRGVYELTMSLIPGQL